MLGKGPSWTHLEGTKGSLPAYCGKESLGSGPWLAGCSRVCWAQILLFFHNSHGGFATREALTPSPVRPCLLLHWWSRELGFLSGSSGVRGSLKFNSSAA